MTRIEPTLDLTGPDARAEQIEILRRLDAVVGDIDVSKLDDIPNLERHIPHLHELGLIRYEFRGGLSERGLCGVAAIRAEGRKQLGSDGGIAADATAVTIKLHDETLQLIEGWIRLANLEPSEREKWLRKLRELPQESTKHLVLELLRLGIASGPAALSAARSVLGG